MSEPLEIGLDLDKHFLPSWAQQSANAAAYAHYEGGDEGLRRGGDRDFGRSPRREGFNRRGPARGPGGPGGPGGPRQSGPPRGPRRDFGGPGGGQRPGLQGGGAPGLHWNKPGARPGDRGPRQDFPPREVLPEIEVSLSPEAAGVQSLARQIKLSGRAYPLFEVAGLVVQKPDRYDVVFKTIRRKDGTVAQRLFECTLDGSVWLSEDEVVRHVLRQHFDTFYQTDKIPCDPPKGVWTLVAQFDEVILGPPNYHGYQERLREIHAQRAPRLPFEIFKGKVRMVKDEAAVKQWIESQSSRLEYTTLNVPEPKKLSTLDEVTAHFNEVHKANVITEVESWALKRGQNSPRLPGPLNVLLRQTVDRERRFPIRTATSLSQQFASAGLQFFKRDKVVVHVAVARPHYLDLDATPVKDGIKNIVEFINARPGCTRRHLLDALAPTPAPAPVPAAPAPAPESGATTPAAEPAPAAPATPGPTAEQASLISDLHWLVHQGHVIEFANGHLETAKKPAPKPPPPPKPAPPAAAKPPAATPAPTPSPAAETPAAEAPAAPAVAEPSPAADSSAPADVASEPPPPAPEPALPATAEPAVLAEEPAAQI